jgi:hypothetical protein
MLTKPRERAAKEEKLQSRCYLEKVLSTKVAELLSHSIFYLFETIDSLIRVIIII